MKTLKLTYNQGKKVIWNNETIRVSRNGNIYYVLQDFEGNLIAVDWTGKEFKNLNITSDFEGSK